MKIQIATMEDFSGWLELAAQVEHLFGPMVHEDSFLKALEGVILKQQAFCFREQDGAPGTRLCAGILVSKEDNEIAWFVVERASRGKGLGRALLSFAMAQLDPSRDISVTTFAPGIPEGLAARALYQNLGFEDRALCEPTPAGIATVLMIKAARPADSAESLPTPLAQKG